MLSRHPGSQGGGGPPGARRDELQVNAVWQAPDGRRGKGALELPRHTMRHGQDRRVLWYGSTRQPSTSRALESKRQGSGGSSVPVGSTQSQQQRAGESGDDVAAARTVLRMNKVTPFDLAIQPPVDRTKRSRIPQPPRVDELYIAVQCANLATEQMHEHSTLGVTRREVVDPCDLHDPRTRRVKPRGVAAAPSAEPALAVTSRRAGLVRRCRAPWFPPAAISE